MSSRDEIKIAIHERWLELRDAGLVTPDRSRRGIECPYCGSGTGKKGTGPTSHPQHPGHFRCWACGKQFDILDAVQAVQGTDFLSALRLSVDALGLQMDSDIHLRPKTQGLPFPAEKAARTTISADGGSLVPICGYPAKPPDTLDCPEVRKYLKSRHLSAGTAVRLGIRYDKDRSCLIVPTGGEGYQARNLRTGQRLNAAGIPMRPFNAGVLLKGSPVFVVEGWEDAASIEDVGGAAVALNGTPHVKSFLAVLEHLRSEGRSIPPLILSLDNDEAGSRCQEILSAELQRRQISHLVTVISGNEKDANDLLRADRASLAAAVKRAQIEMQEMTSERLPLPDVSADISEMQPEKPVLHASDWNMLTQKEDLLAKLADTAAWDGIRSGFGNLDRALDGGFYPGVVVLGALTGAGKTTFAMQIADFIAASGRPVLTIALEMSRVELLARSLSRLSGVLSLEGDMYAQGLSARDILRGRVDLLREQAMERYFDTIAPNMHILEGLGDIGVQDVVDAARTVADETGRAPFVLLDYLQIVHPPSDRLTEKQAADQNMLTLKRYSRDESIPIMVISSLNRAAYNDDKAGAAALKESGGIEYGSDVVALMRPTSSEQSGGLMNVTLTIEKARHGAKPEPIDFAFLGHLSMFIEEEADNEKKLKASRRDSWR